MLSDISQAALRKFEPPFPLNSYNKKFRELLRRSTDQTVQHHELYAKFLNNIDEVFQSIVDRLEMSYENPQDCADYIISEIFALSLEHDDGKGSSYISHYGEIVEEFRDVVEQQSYNIRNAVNSLGKLVEKISLQNDVLVQQLATRYGDLCHDGLWVDKNGVKSANIIQQVANYGYLPALSRAGDISRDGKGVRRDLGQALLCYCRSDEVEKICDMLEEDNDFSSTFPLEFEDIAEVIRIMSEDERGVEVLRDDNINLIGHLVARSYDNLTTQDLYTISNNLFLVEGKEEYNSLSQRYIMECANIKFGTYLVEEGFVNDFKDIEVSCSAESGELLYTFSPLKQLPGFLEYEDERDENVVIDVRQNLLSIPNSGENVWVPPIKLNLQKLKDRMDALMLPYPELMEGVKKTIIAIKREDSSVEPAIVISRILGCDAEFTLSDESKVWGDVDLLKGFTPTLEIGDFQKHIRPLVSAIENVLQDDAVLDNPFAQHLAFRLALCYKNGVGVETNQEKYEELLQRVADKNYPPAFFVIAYDEEQKGNKDYANFCIRRASDLGFAPAHAELASNFLSEESEEVSENDGRIIYDRLREGIRQKCIDSQIRLSEFHLNGEVVPRDNVRAFDGMLEAVKSNQDDTAYYAVGDLLNSGYGTVRDTSKALTWLATAAAKGSEGALDDLCTTEFRILPYIDENGKRVVPPVTPLEGKEVVTLISNMRKNERSEDVLRNPQSFLGEIIELSKDNLNFSDMINIRKHLSEMSMPVPQFITDAVESRMVDVLMDGNNSIRRSDIMFSEEKSEGRHFCKIKMPTAFNQLGDRITFFDDSRLRLYSLSNPELEEDRKVRGYEDKFEWAENLLRCFKGKGRIKETKIDEESSEMAFHLDCNSLSRLHPPATSFASAQIVRNETQQAQVRK